MATPVRYIPQFVQSNLGLLNNIISKRDRQFDIAKQQQLATEDKFKSLQVDPVDIELKNEVLNDYQGQAQDILKKYNGDYYAASDDLARLGSSMKSSTPINLLMRRKQLGEEERKIMNQYGTDAIVAHSIYDQNLRDKNGDWIDPSQLKSKIYNAAQIYGRFNREYGSLKNRTWQTDPKHLSGDMSGFLGYESGRGIHKNEVAGYRDEMFKELKQQYGDLDDNTLMNIADNAANSLVVGSQTHYMQDPMAIARAKAALNGQSTEGQNYRAERSNSISADNDKAKEMNSSLDSINTLNSLIKKRDDFNKKWPDLTKQPDGEKDPSQQKYIDDLNNEISDYTNSVKKDYPIINQLIKKGYSETEAIELVRDNLQGGRNAVKVNNIYYANDPTSASAYVRNAFGNNNLPGRFEKFDPEEKEWSDSDTYHLDYPWVFNQNDPENYNYGINKILGNKKIKNVGIDWNDGNIMITDNNDDVYRYPVDKIPDIGFRTQVKTYKAVNDALNSQPTLGDNKIPGTNYYISTKVVDDESGIPRIESDLMLDKGGKKIKVDKSLFYNTANSEFFDYMTKTPEIHQTKGTKLYTN